MASNYEGNPGIYPSLTTTVEPDIRNPNDMNKHLRVRK